MNHGLETTSNALRTSPRVVVLDHFLIKKVEKKAVSNGSVDVKTAYSKSKNINEYNYTNKIEDEGRKLQNNQATNHFKSRFPN